MAMDKVLLLFKVLKGKKTQRKLLIFDIVEIIINLDKKQLVIEKPMCIQSTTHVPVYNLYRYSLMRQAQLNYKIKANTYSSKNNYPSGPSQCLKIGEGTQYGDNMPPLR